MAKIYKCKVCGYESKGKLPEVCPICGAAASEFTSTTEKINKENNVYIFIYTAVIIVIVSLLLSVTSGALKDRQGKNVELDKKKQILSSLNLDLKGKDAAALYTETIKKYVALNEVGEEVKDLTDNFNYEFAAGEYPLYIAEVNGETKYIIPLNGAGLWGAIWGYLALNDDRNTVYGAYFNHASETPGLGANIATKKFQDQFHGKHILHNNTFASIAVMKQGTIAEGQEQVDAISGGTITSKGVESMLANCLGKYEAFLTTNNVEEEAAEAPENVEQTNEEE